MPRKLLITDAHSSLGQGVLRAFEAAPFAVITPWPKDVDMCSSEALVDYLKANDVAIIINTLGWREAPDEEQCLEFVKSSQSIADAAARAGAVLIHLSSNRVFGAENKSAYDEDDNPNPLNEIGRAFLSAERSVARQVQHHICLRVGWIIDPVGPSVFSHLLSDLVSEGEPLQTTHQRRGAPVSTGEIGRVLLAMVQQISCGADNWGVFHLATGDPCTAAEFTETVADILQREGVLKRDWQVEKLTDSQLETSGEPHSSVLTVRRCRDNFGYQVRSWRQGLAPLIRDWLLGQQLTE